MQPLDSTSRTGITPIIEELQPVWDPLRLPLFMRGATPKPRFLGMNAKLSGDAVLVDQAAEPVGSLGSVHAGELPNGRVGD